jgi:hypothetical protein
MLSAKPLGSFIGKETEKPIMNAIASFSCKDKDVEYFLKNKAAEFEKRDKSRTYLVFDDDRYLSGDATILAYFTLSLKSLEFGDTLSKNKIKDIDGFSKEVSGVAIALIGQLGKDEGEAIDVLGEDLLDLCMDKIFQVKNLIGGRYVLIECHDIDKVVDFYRNNGFERLQVDNSDNYLQMVRRI